MEPVLEDKGNNAKIANVPSKRVVLLPLPSTGRGPECGVRIWKTRRDSPHSINKQTHPSPLIPLPVEGRGKPTPQRVRSLSHRGNLPDVRLRGPALHS